MFSLRGESCLQHSHFKLRHIRVQRCSFQRLGDGLASFHGVYDFIDPETGGAVAGIGLLVIRLLDGIEKFFFFFLVQLFAAALQLLYLISTSVPAAASPLMTAYLAVGQAKTKRGSKALPHMA